jgi:hypothetical protein
LVRESYFRSPSNWVDRFCNKGNRLGLFKVMG